MSLIPECVVDGCDNEVAGLTDGYPMRRRDGPVCNDCWDYAEDHTHLPDEEPRGQVCIACEREAGNLVGDDV